MRDILRVLVKVFAIQFYQSHISLFLFVLGISAGFMRAEDHSALGAAMMSSPLLATIPILIWTAYSIIVVKFNSDLLDLPENRFIYALSFADKKDQLSSIVIILAVQLSPALLYGAFLGGIAVAGGRYTELCEITLALFVLTISSAFHLLNRLRSFRDHNVPSRFTIFVNRKFLKPFPLFFPEWIARKELFVLVGTKVCAMILIFAASQLYKFDTYDVRLIAMAVLLSFAAQSHLIWNLHFFENRVMMLTRNMPLTFVKRLMNLLATLLLLLIPESAFLAGRFPAQLSIYDLISALSIGWCVCIFFYGFLYSHSFLLDELTTRIFFFVMGLLVLILFKVPLLIISALLFVTGCWLWFTNYYQYETRSEPEKRTEPNLHSFQEE